MELLVLLALIALNGVFAASEMALVSARTARLEAKAAGGDRGADAALRLGADPSLFLSTVQVGITTIGILSGVFGENALAALLVSAFDGLPLIGAQALTLATIAMVLIVTYLSVVFGELVPKRLALLAPERFAMRVARPMGVLARIAYPFVTLFSRSGDAILRLLRADRPADAGVSDDDVRAMLSEGARSGVFEAHEEAMVTNVLRLDDLHVSALMTPRSRVRWIDLDAPLDAQWAALREGRHQAYPVARGSIDRIVGVIDVRELIGHEPVAPGAAIEAFVRPALLVPETISGLRLLARLRESRAHLALVLDEYGNVEGLLSRTDLLETIVGELPMPDEAVGDEAVRRPDGSWSLDGVLSLVRAAEVLECPAVAAVGGDVHTVAGLVIGRLGRIPRIGEAFELEHLRFEVLDMDGYRVDRVLVSELGGS